MWPEVEREGRWECRPHIGGQGSDSDEHIDAAGATFVEEAASKGPGSALDPHDRLPQQTLRLWHPIFVHVRALRADVGAKFGTTLSSEFGRDPGDPPSR